MSSTKAGFLMSFYICYIFSILQDRDAPSTQLLFQIESISVSCGLSDVRHYMERRDIFYCGPRVVRVYIIYVLFLLLFDHKNSFSFYMWLFLVQVYRSMYRWSFCDIKLCKSGRCSFVSKMFYWWWRGGSILRPSWWLRDVWKQHCIFQICTA